MSTQSDPKQEVKPWVPSTSSFGARLALLRQNIGWQTIKEAALACGINRQSWKNWEAGRGVAEMDHVCEKISSRTGVDHYWLVTGKKAPSTQVPLGLSEQPELPGFQLAA